MSWPIKIKSTESRVEERIENLKTLIKEHGGRMEYIQVNILSFYKERFGKNNAIPQGQFSKLIKKHPEVFKVKNGFLSLVDHTEKVDAVRNSFEKNHVKLGFAETYVIHAESPENVLATLSRHYKSQILETHIIGKKLYITTEFDVDYSDIENHKLNGASLISVVQHLDYELNHKKK